MDTIYSVTDELKKLLLTNGADIVGIGDLRELPETVRYGLSVGISIAVKYPKEIIRGISEFPTQEYFNWYTSLNNQLDALVSLGAEFLENRGYRTVAKTRAEVGRYSKECTTTLPHKTVATRAGIGWIGKSALLITRQYGSMVRLSSILTNAPLITAEPVNNSQCGNCNVCQNTCPAKAIHGMLWNVSVLRDELIDYQRCSQTAQLRSEQSFGKRIEICGKCIEVCPYTKRYLNQQ